jgi:hypothetical protein
MAEFWDTTILQNKHSGLGDVKTLLDLMSEPVTTYVPTFSVETGTITGTSVVWYHYITTAKHALVSFRVQGTLSSTPAWVGVTLPFNLTVNNGEAMNGHTATGSSFYAAFGECSFTTDRVVIKRSDGNNFTAALWTWRMTGWLRVD